MACVLSGASKGSRWTGFQPAQVKLAAMLMSVADRKVEELLCGAETAHQQRQQPLFDTCGLSESHDQRFERLFFF